MSSGISIAHCDLREQDAVWIILRLKLHWFGLAQGVFEIYIGSNNTVHYVPHLSIKINNTHHQIVSVNTL